MTTIVGVRFKRNGKIYYFHPQLLSIRLHDSVIVETARGLEFGEVVLGPKDVPEEDLVSPLKDVLRIATDEDRQKHESNLLAEKEAFDICQKKIALHKLPINLVEVSYTFDVSKIVFYFTAEGRVDFRELVKDLASVFRTRIELRQIGVRDQAKVVGGIGSCGRVLCCHSVLGEFQPVSIKMAKKQNLSLNPAKISGVCGRLMCCLKFENYDDQPGKKKGRVYDIPPEDDDMIIIEDED
ncbi:MAG: stage 0 sporulation family protein [Bacillota bacterium]|nr:stage 0 sporulation family protein [Bacillota bacterium]